MKHEKNSSILSRRDFLKTSAALSAAPLVTAACSAGKRRPNIVWIMTDDQRIDSLKCYGSPWAESPNVDALARSGVLFKNTIAQCPVCVPSRTSMLSGQYCHTVGVMENRSRVKEGTYPLPMHLTDNGYQVTNIGKVNFPGGEPFDNAIPTPGYGGPAAEPFRLKGEFAGKEKDYDIVVVSFPKPSLYGDSLIVGGTYPLPEEQSEHGITTSNAIDYIENSVNEPFFLRVSMISPHTPVLAPKPYDTMFSPDDIPLPLPTAEELESQPEIVRRKLWSFLGSAGKMSEKEIRKSWAAYYGLCASVDNQVGRLMESLKKNNLLDNTMVVFASDQGVQMGEHGIYMKRNFYEQTVLCPLIFSWPGAIPQGEVIDSQVEMIDLMPTLFDLAGLPPVSGINGRSLMPLISGETASMRDAAFSEIDHATSQYQFLREGLTGRRVMIRTEEWKLVYFIDSENPDGALYNLQEDPGEIRNLYKDTKYKEIVGKLEKQMNEWNSTT